MDCCYATSSFSIFILIAILLVFLWSIAVFIALFFDNLFYRSLKFDRTNTFDNFCVALTVLVLFFITAYLIKIAFLPDLEKRMFSIRNRGEKAAIDVTKRPESVGGALASDTTIAAGRF